tara:strand:+ start:5294 stop:6409 length:1116 start_codon:yes stop_codon:yes gene_type:complete
MATSSELDIPPILRLPDEILLHIASSIDGDNACTALRHLALTHRRFRHIVEEKLIRNGVVQVRSISEYVHHLSEHPEWMPHFKHIEFRHNGDIYNIYSSQKARTACYGMIRDLLPTYPSVNLSEDFDGEAHDGAIWLMVVLALMPNAQEVSLRLTDIMRPRTYDWILYSCKAPRGLLSALGNIVWPRLEFIRVTTESEGRFCREAPARFNHLCNLKVLETTSDFLDRAYFLSPESMLPSSLEVLQVFCDQENAPWHFLLNKYHDICRTDYFSHLRRIQLCFNQPCRSVAQYAVCNTAHFYSWSLLGHIDLTDFLSKWRKANICLQTTFKDRDQPRFELGSYRQSCLLEEIQCVKQEMEKSIDSSAKEADGI